MVNYGMSNGLVQIDETNTYNGSDPFVQGKPLALDYNEEVFEEEFPPSSHRNDDEPIIEEEP